MCHYGTFHKIEQYRDKNGLHCLCYNGYSGPQCDTVGNRMVVFHQNNSVFVESCPGERSIEAYGSVEWADTAVNRSSSILCPYNADGERLFRKCVWNDMRHLAAWENVTHNDVCKRQVSP